MIAVNEIISPLLFVSCVRLVLCNESGFMTLGSCDRSQYRTFQIIYHYDLALWEQAGCRIGWSAVLVLLSGCSL